VQAGRAAELVQLLQLAPHPEGGWYREHFRSASAVPQPDGRGPRQALTAIDFLLAAGERSAWHRVASDEAWHLVEGGPLQLWLLPPDCSRLELRTLAPVAAAGQRPRTVVPAHWWQAAVPAPGAAFALVGATVGPGFDFADFSFGRDDPALVQALARLGQGAQALL
jgi:predicted cupin superfamily sugar epimerase